MDCSWGRIALVTTTATTRHSSGFAGQFFLHLRFQNWTRIVVRSRLFCKGKTVILRDATAGDFELRKPLFLPVSEFRGAVGMLRLHREARGNGSHHKVNRFRNRYVRASCDRKHQAPEKFQAPTAKDVGSDWLEFEDWSFFGFWRLGFGAYHNTSTYHDA